MHSTMPSTMPSAHDLYRQAQWETEASRRAESRYYEAAEQTDIAALPAGQAMLRKVVPPLVALVRVAQAEAKLATKSSAGRLPGWGWPIGLLSAERWAFLAVAVALRTQHADAGGIVAFSEALSRTARTEIEYQDWMQEQRKAKRLAKEAHDCEHHDLLAELKRTYPSVNPRTWQRWRRKVHALRTEPWPKGGVILSLGGKLADLLVQASPHIWHLETRHIGGGRTQVRLALSPEATAIMQQVDQRAAVSRPLRMPMLIPPLAWKYSET